MAIPKICGIETEYGIIHRGVAEPNPITASSFLINAYLGEIDATNRLGPGRNFSSRNVSWNFEDEMPANDIRGLAPVGSMPPEIETHLVNAVLTNGARYYVDHAHPEISTPECTSAESVVRFDRSAELIAIRSMEAANRLLPPEQELVIYKNNSDGKGNSYGCHENYLVDRSTPFGRIVTFATAHFVTRQIYTGAGKVGCEIPGIDHTEVPYQLTARADFFEEEVGLETTLKRPIINTRDEPHADPQRYRRLHVIVGDANMSEVATFLKVGTTALVLAMVEDDWFPDDITFEDPVRAMQQVSWDLSLAQPLRMASGRTATALEVQWHLLERAIDWADTHGLDAVGDASGRETLRRWEETLTALQNDPDSLANTVDWVAKRRVIDAYRTRDNIAWNDARLRALDLQYHDLRPARSLAARVGLEQIVSIDDAVSGMSEPPEDTRAYFRGHCLQRFPDDIVAANWDSLVFDVGDEPLRRVPMLEPSRGTRSHVASLLESCESAAELVRKLVD